MNIEIDLLTISILILILATLLTISYTRAKPAKSPSKPKERRKYPRYKISLRVKYKTLLEEGTSWIKDISEGGARLILNKSLKALKIGEPLEIEINLPYEAQPVYVQGNIAWSEDDHAGLHFEKVIEGDIGKLIQYINEESL